MKNRTALLILAALSIVFSGTLSAQTSDRQNRRGRGGSQQTETDTQKTQEEWENVQVHLKREFPKKYEEIEKLQKTNLFAALEKMRELAKEADLETPSAFGNRRGRGGQRGGENSGRFQSGGERGNSRTQVEAQLKKEFPAEYAEIEKLRISAETKLGELAQKAKVTLPETMESYRIKIEALKAGGKYKAEFEEIEKLQKTDPRAALRKTMELAEKEGIKNPFSGFGRGNFGGGRENANPEPASARGNPLLKLEEVRKKYPEEIKKLNDLRRDDPRAYREGLRKLIEKYDAEQNKK